MSWISVLNLEFLYKELKFPKSRLIFLNGTFLSFSERAFGKSSPSDPFF